MMAHSLASSLEQEVDEIRSGEAGGVYRLMISMR